MRINNWSILYSIGYVLVGAGINGFYKRHQVTGLENIPKDKPIVFASNHQNAFLDPVVISVKLTKPTYYLVRADVFKKPLIAKIFDSINMMPVYRARDGVNTIEANKGVFDRCYDLLAKKKLIIIFPEGNHGKYKELRDLKKGFARIAVGAEEKHGKDIDVNIVPVGINYSNHENMGAELLINFGKPIDISEHVDDIGNARKINETKALLAKSMSDLLIDIPTTGHYQVIHELMMMFDEEILAIEKSKDDSLIEKFKAQKKYIAKAKHYFEQNPDKDLDEEVATFKNEVLDMELRYWLFRKEKHKVIYSIIGLTILLPVHLYGVVNNYLPYKIPVWFVEKKIKDRQFHSSLKMAMGSFLFVLFWLLQTLIIGSFMPPHLQWIYGLSLPLSAWISYTYWIKLLKTEGQIRYNTLSDDKDDKFLLLKEKYVKFKKLFEKITNE